MASRCVALCVTVAPGSLIYQQGTYVFLYLPCCIAAAGVGFQHAAWCLLLSRPLLVQHRM